MSALAGQVAVVTGAGRGIGKAIALGLAVQGATLCLVGRNRETLEEVVEGAGAHNSRAFIYSTDVTLDKDIREFATRLQRDVEGVDILVHSAAVISNDRLESASIEDLDRQYYTNVRAPYFLTQILLPMLRPKQGQIVFMNSTVGLKAIANAGQYAATKHALRAIADSLREEVGADGIRVLSVFLGRTATPMQAAVHQLEGRTYRPELLLQPDDVAGIVVHLLALPRSAEVTDITIRPAIRSY